ncbi:MAG: Maf family protein [Saccharofermentans sp.]|nr:septum formation protein Maf [Clostridiales bacterium]MCR5383440.1 Maf family protein [Saccharofermentans sp.]
MESVKLNKKIILASASPRRRELLSLVTDDFEIITADIDERAAEIRMEEEGVPANKVSERLAEIKAEAVFDSLTEEEKDNFIVIGADTSVILDDVIYGKPEDREDAVRMLSSMSGRAHVVATGVALFTRSSKRVFTEETRVEFNALDDYQKTLISEYCDSRSPFDKAGAYGIQDKGALLIKGIDGDYSNVVGLPVARLARELAIMVKYSLE